MNRLPSFRLYFQIMGLQSISPDFSAFLSFLFKLQVYLPMSTKNKPGVL